ncbi:hypothetical protein E2C01_005133 [Portunus trituberculatus]|uniref:Uncharacterized protein n=1 Tax=Portunus trituberculatus TaxID=210409 RepID=A0A5B7CRK3_PORTR|nr:hypothetical protein [Portunus trituberculatus]
MEEEILTGVCSAYVAVVLRHIALGTAAVVGAPCVVAKVSTWRLLTFIDILTLSRVVDIVDITLVALAGVPDGLVNTLMLALVVIEMMCTVFMMHQ